MKKHLKIAQAWAKLLDSQFGIGRIKFGLDPIIGLIPGMGDISTAVFSLYLIWIAKKINVPQREINIMLKHIAVDLIIGLVPFIGEVGDFMYKANQKNWDIISKHVKNPIYDAEIVEEG